MVQDVLPYFCISDFDGASENFLKISLLSFLIPGKNVYQWYVECDLFVIITGTLFD